MHRVGRTRGRPQGPTKEAARRSEKKKVYKRQHLRSEVKGTPIGPLDRFAAPQLQSDLKDSVAACFYEGLPFALVKKGHSSR